MFAGLFVLVPLALLLPAALVVLLVLVLTARPDGDIGPATAAARRHAVAGGVLAVVAGVGAAAAVAALASSVGGLTSGRLLAVAVLVAGIAHTLVLALTELTWPRPTGTHRSGVLVRRRVADVLPRGLLRAAAATAGALVLVLLVGSLVAGDDGRSLTRTTAAPFAVTATSSGPFPGSFYAVPLLACLALLVGLVWLSLHLVVSRPAVTGAHPDADTALRTASAHRVLRGAAASTALTLGPVLLFASSAVRGIAAEAQRLEALAILLAVLAVVACLVGLVLLLLPAPRVPAPPVAVVHPVPGGVPA